MSIFSWIFGTQTKESNSKNSISSEQSQLLEFENRLFDLLNSDSYIARRDYKPLCDGFIDLFN